LRVSVLGAGRIAKAVLGQLTPSTTIRVLVWARRHSALDGIQRQFRCSTTQELSLALSADAVVLALPEDAVRDLFSHSHSWPTEPPVVVSLVAALDLATLSSLLNTQAVIRVICSPALARGDSHVLATSSFSVESEATSFLSRLFPRTQVLYLNEEEMPAATIFFCSVGLLAYFLQQMHTLATDAGLRDSSAAALVRILPHELNALGELTGYDFGAAHRLCATPKGIVENLTTALQDSDFQENLRRTVWAYSSKAR